MRQVLNCARGFAIGANTERIGTFDLQQIGKVIESGRRLGIVDRHWARSFGNFLVTDPSIAGSALTWIKCREECGYASLLF